MIRVGPAGWSYQDWEGMVYPPKKGSKFDPLVYLADIFDTIELNNTFYRPPTLQMSKSWAKRVQSNPRFKFTAKLYRNFTHERQSLTEVDEGVFKSGLEPLVESGRLGVLLLQFPYSFHNTEDNRGYVQKLAGQFKEYPLVLEIRHASWDRGSAYQFLRDLQVGFCNIDQPQVSYSIGPTKKVTSKVGYLRLHGRNVKEWFHEDAGRERPGALFQHVLVAALADAGDAGVSLHRHHHVALVESLVQVRRLMDANPRNLGLGQRGARRPGGEHAGCRGRRQGLQEGSSVHSPNHCPQPRSPAQGPVVSRGGRNQVTTDDALDNHRWQAQNAVGAFRFEESAR